MILSMISWLASLVYAAYMLMVYIGLRKLPRSTLLDRDEQLPSCSVVIAARDEELRIGRLLDALEAQDYPRDRIEVIVVDDRSRDRTAELVRARSGVLNYRVVSIREGESTGRAPKKYALTRGISMASGDVIVTTDADCWMGPQWLRALLSPFVDPRVQGATGVSRFLRDEDEMERWWDRYESLEHLSYSVMAAGTLGLGHVSNAHGSNLAARRSVYERIGGYSSNDGVASGDDVFLLQDVAQRGGRVVFVDRREAYVYSKPVESIPEWINQRARWSSKGFYYPPFLMYLLVGTFAFYASAGLSLPLALAGRMRVFWSLAMIGGKLTAETLIMREGTRRLEEPFAVPRYLLTQLLQAPAILFAGIRGQLFSFTWKGQRFEGLSALREGKGSGDKIQPLRPTGTDS